MTKHSSFASYRSFECNTFRLLVFRIHEKPRNSRTTINSVI